MELKRWIGMIVAVMFIMVSKGSIVEAKNDVINYGRVSVVMPRITAEIKGSGYASSEVSAMLGTEKLSVESVNTFDKQSHSTCAYVLMDLSTSMRDSFELAKKNVIAYINQMGEKDKLILVTFGKADINIPLTGSETKEEMIEQVNALQCDQKGTLFYEALNRAYELSRASVSNYDREYVLAFSDGIDVQKGSTTYREIEKKYQNHELPIYAYCAATSSKKGSDRFGELARLSGGSISIIHNEAEFTQFLGTVDDITLIRMTAQNNQADGKSKQLSIKMGELQAECMIPITRSAGDTSAPVAKTEKDTDASNGIVILFVAIGILIIGGGAIILIVILRKRSKGKETDDVAAVEPEQEMKSEVFEYAQKEPCRIRHHIQIDETVHLRMKVKTGRTNEQIIDIDVVSSLIIGRSDVCDIYIDDSKLSRQHFAIENDKGKVFLMDLQSRNGTTLNGIRVNDRMELHNGDRIGAGLSDIIITVISR